MNISISKPEIKSLAKAFRAQLKQNKINTLSMSQANELVAYCIDKKKWSALLALINDKTMNFKYSNDRFDQFIRKHQEYDHPKLISTFLDDEVRPYYANPPFQLCDFDTDHIQNVIKDYENTQAFKEYLREFSYKVHKGIFIDIPAGIVFYDMNIFDLFETEKFSVDYSDIDIDDEDDEGWENFYNNLYNELNLCMTQKEYVLPDSSLIMRMPDYKKFVDSIYFLYTNLQPLFSNNIYCDDESYNVTEAFEFPEQYLFTAPFKEKQQLNPNDNLNILIELTKQDTEDLDYMQLYRLTAYLYDDKYNMLTYIHGWLTGLGEEEQDIHENDFYYFMDAHSDFLAQTAKAILKEIEIIHYYIDNGSILHIETIEVTDKQRGYGLGVGFINAVKHCLSDDDLMGVPPQPFRYVSFTTIHDCPIPTPDLQFYNLSIDREDNLPLYQHLESNWIKDQHKLGKYFLQHNKENTLIYTTHKEHFSSGMADLISHTIGGPEADFIQNMSNEEKDEFFINQMKKLEKMARSMKN